MQRSVLRLMTLSVLLAIFMAPLQGALAAEGMVNINTATAEQLALLPRIGPSIAERVVEFRQQNGRFKTIEDLMLVRGIGEATFQLLKPYINVSGETTLTEKVSVARN